MSNSGLLWAIMIQSNHGHNNYKKKNATEFSNSSTIVPTFITNGNVSSP